jgi:hypothetical protein
MRYPLLDQSGKVVNVIEIEPGANWMPPKDYVLGEPNDTACIGDIFDGNNYTKPPIDPPPTRWPVSRATLVDRLQAAAKLAAFRSALDSAPLYARERFAARTEVWSDETPLLTVLAAIGADPAAILAPET